MDPKKKIDKNSRNFSKTYGWFLVLITGLFDEGSEFPLRFHPQHILAEDGQAIKSNKFETAMNPGDVSMAPYDKQSPFHTGYMSQDGPVFFCCETVGSGINLC